MEAALTVSKGVLYGVLAVLAALLVLTSGLALVYFQQEERQASLGQKYVGELDAALSDYRSLKGSFNASVKGFGATLALLADAVENLNTSTPAYVNASLALNSLWESYRQLAGVGGGAPGIAVSMMVDYGNGTRAWYNDTAAPPGLNAYGMSVLLLRGNLGATWYPQFGEHFINEVNGIGGNSSTSWFVWEHGGGSWTVSGTGADGIQADNGTVFGLWLCGYDSSYNPVCAR